MDINKRIEQMQRELGVTASQARKIIENEKLDRADVLDGQDPETKPTIVDILPESFPQSE
jgi:hypothetical protein